MPIFVDEHGNSRYEGGGLCREVISHETVNHHDWNHSIVNEAGWNHINVWLPLEEMHQLRTSFLTLIEYLHHHHGQYPNPTNNEDHIELINIANRIHSFSTPSPLIQYFHHFSECEVSPLCTIMGGIAASEVMKRFGQYLPLADQTWMIDYWNIVPLISSIPPSESSSKALSSSSSMNDPRYESSHRLFGPVINGLLSKQNIFIVGAGAIGCELIKLAALMGLASSNGMIHVTDMDRIELSNLSRQLLFRHGDIGKLKSECAARAARIINPNINIKHYEVKVPPPRPHSPRSLME